MLLSWEAVFLDLLQVLGCWRRASSRLWTGLIRRQTTKAWEHDYQSGQRQCVLSFRYGLDAADDGTEPLGTICVRVMGYDMIKPDI